ncbi:MAG: hypothetical protein BroJett026_35330 [Betaproteobacteria bacterium]|nr:MAG: hypothetical protein BroJett026_35330 [Betaproteobacteria bacterium]
MRNFDAPVERSGPALAYERLRRQYITRHMLGDIGLADADIGLEERGDPRAARRLLNFLASEVEHGYAPPPQLLQYLARAVRKAETDFAEKLAAFGRNGTTSGVRRPAFDIASALGLRFSTAGAAPQQDGLLEQAVATSLNEVMRGRPLEDAEQEAANLAGRSVSRIRKQSDASRPAHWYDVAMQVVSHANALLADQGIEFTRELDHPEDFHALTGGPAWQKRRQEWAVTRARCQDAKDAAILEVAKEHGMLPREIRKALARLWELLDRLEAEQRDA